MLFEGVNGGKVGPPRGANNPPSIHSLQGNPGEVNLPFDVVA